jgi:uncharacterized membrane protein YphA (DoxX/SURF4 family)
VPFCGYTFPSGSPGLGLLLLRGFVALTLIVQGLAILDSQKLSPLEWCVAALIAISAACLLIGFLTPIVAAVTGAFAIVTSSFHFSTYSLVGLIVLAVVIVLLGPGAFSVDSRLFGRREILIPHSTRDVRR